MDNSKKNETEVNKAVKAIKRAFSKRFSDLVDEYLDNKNKKIKDEYEQRQAIYNKRRMAGIDAEKPTKAKMYTVEDMMACISTTYNVDLNKYKYSRYRNGTSLPTMEMVRAFSKFFGVSYEYLLNDECTIENEITENIKKQIGLNDDAVNNLRSIKNEYAITFLNALLGNRDSEALLAQFYLDIYSVYESREYYNNGKISLDRLGKQEEYKAMIIFRSLDGCLTPIAKEEFEKQLKRDAEIDSFMATHPEL